jgi:hypothetical protein
LKRKINQEFNGKSNPISERFNGAGDSAGQKFIEQKTLSIKVGKLTMI